jgi:hypothetical protein
VDNRLDEKTAGIFRSGVRSVVELSNNFGRVPYDDVRAAFRSAIAHDYLDALEAEDRWDDEVDAYRPALTAKMMHIVLWDAGVDLDDLHIQERLWAIVHELATDAIEAA